jgi:hypothetical protein
MKTLLAAGKFTCPGSFPGYVLINPRWSSEMSKYAAKYARTLSMSVALIPSMTIRSKAPAFEDEDWGIRSF